MIRYYVAPGLKYKDGLNVRMDSGKSKIERMSDITDVVCEVLGVEKQKIFTPCRQREFVLARQISMYFIRKSHPDISLKNIGIYFGGRDHTTTIHSIQTLKDLIHTDSTISTKVMLIEGKI